MEYGDIMEEESTTVQRLFGEWGNLVNEWLAWKTRYERAKYLGNFHKNSRKVYE